MKKAFLCVILVVLSQAAVATLEEHLIIAIKDKDYVEAKRFVEKGANLDFRTLPRRGMGTISLLELAYSYNADNEMYELLFGDIAINPKRANPVLFLVAHSDNTEMAEYWRLKGGDVNYRNMIFMAVSRSRVNMTKWLLTKGVDPNKPNNGGERALMYSIFSICRGINDETISYEPSFEILEHLMLHGADAMLPVYKGKNIFYYIESVAGISDQDKERLREILNKRPAKVEMRPCL